MKYKLLKDLPNTKAGEIRCEIAWVGYIPCLLPDLFEKVEEFKVGDWVKYSFHSMGSGAEDKIFRIVKIDNRLDRAYENDWASYEMSCLTKATSGEIKTHLIEEAGRRGFVIGVKYFSADGDNFEAQQIKGDFYYCNHDMLTDGWGGCVYCRGKWAEIIKEEKKMVVGSYEVKFGADYIVVGCKRYSELDVLNLLSAMEYLKITSIEIAGVKVPFEIVRKIAERLK